MEQTIEEVSVAWWKLSWVKRFFAKYFGWKWRLGEEQPDGFTRPTTFYAFWCRACGSPAKDYSHGHIQYLFCRNCRTERGF